MNWGEPELAALAKRYGDATVIAALRIQRHIQRNGIDGIHFKKTAEYVLEKDLPRKTRRNCAKHMRREVRKTKRR